MGRNTDEWLFYTEIDFSDKKILQYHIDTRDFHCYTNTEKAEKDLNLKTLAKYQGKFFYTGEEVVSLLTRYFNESGGKKDWRFFYLKGLDNWQMKYIRIHRTEHGLVVCNNEHYALKKEITNAEVGKDY